MSDFKIYRFTDKTDKGVYCENVWRSLFKISSKTDLGQPMLIRICSSPPNPYFSPGSTMILPFPQAI